ERPAESWERDVLPSRVRGYQPALLDALTQSGELVWVAGAGIRFVERGSARRWLSPPQEHVPSDAASRVMRALEAAGASFTSDLEAATALDAPAVRSALLELARLGLATSDSVESMRAMIAATPRPATRERPDADPSSWLPAGYERGISFPPRAYGMGRGSRRARGGRGGGGWRRGGESDGAMGRAWRGRWFLVHSAGVLGTDESEQDSAHEMALKWLDRYAIVSRECWKNERVGPSWRAVYRELRTLEMRGEVRRGYFVEGLSGAQFALPEALDVLREAGTDSDPEAPWVVVAGADPANAWALPRATRPAWPPRPGARSTLLVTRHGEVRVVAESRGRRLRLASDVDEVELTRALEALVDHAERAIVPAATRRRELRIEQIDGAPAASHPLAGALPAAGFRRDGMAYRRLAPR
ncbi:MAG TPA: hypothetical protein VFG84_01965, partial [Gemmatimonadaceae bacterium]|nr:hypothetical protein [Gemmatimonadaceae bacterium]